MYLNFLIFIFILNCAFSDPFFSFTDKPIFFCLKVCPLYCSPRRSDEDAASLIYLEDNPYSFDPGVWVEDAPIYPPYPYGHFVFCKPKPTTTTTPKTTTTTMATTTEEPNLICMLCKSKCNYPKT